MILCKITDKKDFMNKLLGGDCFYSFLLKEASIHSFIPFWLDGRINTAFFSEDDPDAAHYSGEEFTRWEDVRPICFDMIKGKRTPTRFQFILYLKKEAVEQVLAKEQMTIEEALVQHFVLNVRFEQGELTLTTAVDYSSFTLDKQAEYLWDQSLMKFLSGKQISYTL